MTDAPRRYKADDFTDQLREGEPGFVQYNKQRGRMIDAEISDLMWNAPKSHWENAAEDLAARYPDFIICTFAPDEISACWRGIDPRSPQTGLRAVLEDALEGAEVPLDLNPYAYDMSDGIMGLDLDKLATAITAHVLDREKVRVALLMALMSKGGDLDASTRMMNWQVCFPDDPQSDTRGYERVKADWPK